MPNGLLRSMDRPSAEECLLAEEIEGVRQRIREKREPAPEPAPEPPRGSLLEAFRQARQAIAGD